METKEIETLETKRVEETIKRIKEREKNYTERKKFNAEVLKSKKLRWRVNEIIKTHKKLKNAYFWTPGFSCKYNKELCENCDGTEIKIKEGIIKVSMNYSESNSNCYYSSGFYLDNAKKDIRLLKKLVS